MSLGHIATKLIYSICQNINKDIKNKDCILMHFTYKN